MIEAFGFFVVFIISVLIIKLFSKSLPLNLDVTMKNRLIFIVILAIVLKLVIVGVWYLNVGHSFYMYSDLSTRDSGFYDWSGQYLANYFRQGILFRQEFLNLYGDSLGFPYYVGLIYAFFGHHQIMVSIFNTLASVVLALLMFHIALTLFNNRKIAFWTLIFNLFYSHYVSQSYYLLKDMFLVFLIVIFCWLFMKIGKNRINLLNYFGLFVVTIGIYFIRSLTVLILIGLGGLHLILGLGLKERKVLKSILVLLICLTAIIGLGRLSPRGRTTFEKIEYFSTEEYRGEESTPAYLRGTRGTKEIISSIGSSPLNAFKDLIRSVILIYWGPTYFYQRSGANLFYAYGRFVFWENLGGLMRIFLMPMVIFGFFYCLRKKKSESFLFYSFVVIWTVVMMLTGNAERWALSLMPFVLMFGAVGVVNFNKIKPFYIPYLLLFNLLIAANITLHESLIVAKPLFILTSLGLLWGICRYRQALRK
ncbi:MAG: hypothetical protein ACE5IT_02175 [bacterium]